MVLMVYDPRVCADTTVRQASENIDLHRFYVLSAMRSVTKELTIPKIDWQ